ncbi:antibiotic biosynthesis monooxygenase family protein [Paracoccus pacificus]|uniref:Antibiotic biosynthesis monooxygenase family protein n=1 Tax=Paracoccus pacificus TaxID=1463598 RepID=A0ABW4R9L4_9RHOB
MSSISTDFDGQTIICTFEVTPGTAQDLLEALEDAYRDVISKQPGFVSAWMHMNDAHTRICTYSQWAGRGDYQAMLRNQEMRDRNRHISSLCKSFEPVMYDVTAEFPA